MNLRQILRRVTGSLRGTTSSTTEDRLNQWYTDTLDLCVMIMREDGTPFDIRTATFKLDERTQMGYNVDVILFHEVDEEHPWSIREVLVGNGSTLATVPLYRQIHVGGFGAVQPTFAVGALSIPWHTAIMVRGPR